MVKKILPLAAMEKVIKSVGAERVSEDAKKIMKEILEEKGEKIAERAIKFAQHTGRRTVKKEDIELAFKEIF